MPKLQFRDVANKEYTRKDGYTCIIDEDKHGWYHVDMWTPPDAKGESDNHWHKGPYKELDEALEEFNKWRD